MSLEKTNSKENNIPAKLSNMEKNIPKTKKICRKAFKKSRKRLINNNIKVVPLLKSPSKRRKSIKNGFYKNKNGIIWDNKTIEKQNLDRNLHHKNKISAIKTLYPNGDESDIYQEGINKLNRIKPNEDIINKIVNSFLEKNNEKLNKNDINELREITCGNECVDYLNFFKEKLGELENEKKLSLQNTLINKFQKEVRNLSQSKKNL